MGTLRFLLALSVVIVHSNTIFGFRMVGGQAAVQSFYMISGFYMTMVLNEKYINLNNSYKLFITNRLLRLYPVYWVVLILTLVVSISMRFLSEDSNLGYLQPYKQYQGFISIKTYIILIFTNITVVFQDLIMFLGLDISTGNVFFTSNFRNEKVPLYIFLLIQPAWTVGIEITYYFLAPFIVRRKLRIIFILIGVSIIIKIILMFNGLKLDPWSYRFFPVELRFFLFGTLSYHIHKKINLIKCNPKLSTFVFIFIVLITLTYSYIPFWGYIYIYIPIFFLSIPFVFQISKNWKFDRYIGELSYPMYISHMFVLLTIKQTPLYNAESIGLYLAVLTILFSIILNLFIANPIEKIRQKRVKQYNLEKK